MSKYSEYVTAGLFGFCLVLLWAAGFKWYWIHGWMAALLVMLLAPLPFWIINEKGEAA